MNLINAAKLYFIASYAEMTKVTWPTREQTINYSLLVVGLSIGLAAFFAVLDYALNLGITTLITK